MIEGLEIVCERYEWLCVIEFEVKVDGVNGIVFEFVFWFGRCVVFRC